MGEEGDELQGLFCQAPLKEVGGSPTNTAAYVICCLFTLCKAWDAVNFHNAVIIGRERERMEAKEEEDVKVVGRASLNCHHGYSH